MNHAITINATEPTQPPAWNCTCGDGHQGYDAIDVARAHAASHGIAFAPASAPRYPEIPDAQ